jgi:hypothetical protein
VWLCVCEQVVRQGRRGRPWRERLVLLATDREMDLPVRFALYEYALFRSDNRLLAAAQLPMRTLCALAAPTASDAAGTDSGGAVGSSGADPERFWPMARPLTLPLPAARPTGGGDDAGLELRGAFISYATLRHSFWLRMAAQYGDGGAGPCPYVPVVVMAPGHASHCGCARQRAA